MSNEDRQKMNEEIKRRIKEELDDDDDSSKHKRSFEGYKKKMYDYDDPMTKRIGDLMFLTSNAGTKIASSNYSLKT